jgi:gas vesicle protein GvpA/GvpJ/GvpM family
MSPANRRPSTVPRARPAKRPRVPRPPKPIRPAPIWAAAPPKATHRSTVARIVDDADMSLLDVVDNLLNRGVVLNADVILSLANVDLVYLRLSALLCAADRLLPGGRR